MRTGQLVAGRYRLEQEIGSGSMGTVWRALDEDEGLTVVHKRAVRQTAADGERARRQLRREAKIAAQVTHPHVVTFRDEVLEGPERYLVLEHVPSQSLALAGGVAAESGAQECAPPTRQGSAEVGISTCG